MQRFHQKNLIWLASAVVIYLLLQVLVQVGVINFYYESTFINIMINIIFAVGLNLILGVAGQFSLGHAGFIAIGAYSAAIIGKAVSGLAGLFAGMAVGVVISIVIAYLVGLPTLRLKGDYLAIATLGVAEIIRVALNNMKITNEKLTLSDTSFVFNEAFSGFKVNEDVKVGKFVYDLKNKTGTADYVLNNLGSDFNIKKITVNVINTFFINYLLIFRNT